MRIAILSIAFLLLAFAAQSQVLKSAGVWYFLDVDSMAARPAVLPSGTELAYVVGTKKIYYWHRGTSTWTEYGSGSTFNRDSIYFDSSIIGSGTVSDPWGVDSTLFATIAGVGDSIAAALGYVAANFFPLQGGLLTGTAGAGFVGFPIQSSPPSTPSTGFSLFAGSTGNNISWMQPDGFFRRLVSPVTGTPRQYQFMARSYTLADSADVAALPTGTGTTNYYAKWSSTNALTIGNLFDNNTVVSILNSKPFQLGQWTTAGRPTGVQGYFGYNTTTNGLDWYNGTRWASGLESTFARGTATRVPFFDANGQVTDNSGLTFANPSTLSGTVFSSLLSTTSSTATANNQYHVGAIFNHSYTPGAFTGGKHYVASFLTNDATGSTIAIGRPHNIGFHATITSDFATRTLILDSGTSGGNIILRKAGVQVLSVGSPFLDYPGYFYSSQASTYAGLNAGFVSYNIGASNLVFREGTTGWKTAFGHDNNGAAVIYAQRANTNFVAADIKLRLSGLTGYAEFLNNTGGVLLGKGTTAQTPTEEAGLIRYNSDSTLYQGYQGTTRVYFATRAYARSLALSLPTTITSGHVAYSNGTSLVGSANHFWDNTNGFLGVKTATPLQELDVNGDAYIRDSTRLTTTPAHSSITGLLTRDISGWAGLATLGSGLSYSGGVIGLTNEIKRDTTIYVTDADYNFSAAITSANILKRYNNIIVYSKLSASSTSDNQIFLHTPSSDFLQCTIIIYSNDASADSDATSVDFTSNGAVDGAGGTLSSYAMAPGQRVEIRVADDGGYKWFFN